MRLPLRYLSFFCLTAGMVLTCAAQTLPTGWFSAEVGAPGQAGGSEFSAGLWTINGGGGDIWNTADQCHLTYRAIEGDATLTAYVESVAGTNDYAKAGLMMRSDSDADAACAAVVVTPSQGIRFQWRSDAGVATQEILAGGTIPAPVWLRLTRRGNRMAGSYSYDGYNWLQLGEPQTVNAATSALAGLCVSAGDDAALNTSTFSSVSLTLPDWSSRDIGSPWVPGRTDFDGSTVTVEASGADIFGSFDQFHFASQTMVGDTTLVARVADLIATGTNTKGGIMIRASEDQSASYAFLFLNPSQGVSFEYRNGTGEAAVAVDNEPSLSTPRWLKLERVGDVFRAYHSEDGASWTQLGDAQSIAMHPTIHAGLALTANNNYESSTARYTNVGLLPGGWSNDDVGAPGVRGSASYDGLNWVVNGGGEDIWYSSDQFHYVSRDYPGDVTVVVRVGSLHGTGDHAKAGLMIRGGTAADASYAFVFVTPSSVSFEGRSVAGIASVGIGEDTSVSTPRWLKLVRSGNSFTAYHSSDGEAWVQLGGSFTAAVGTDARIGLAVNAFSENTLNSATFRFLKYGPNDLKDPFLKQSGIYFRNDRGAGEVVPLRGTNVGGWMMHEKWFGGMDASYVAGETEMDAGYDPLPDAISAYSTLTDRFGVNGRNEAYATYMFNYITERDLDMMQEWGINCVRLSFWWANVYETGGSWRAEAFTHFDWLVDEAWKRGIYTILDYHGVPGGSAAWPSSGDSSGTYFATPSYHALVGESWQKIAAHFRGHPGIAGYDMLNEPGGAWTDGSETDKQNLLSHQNYLYNAIRGGDPDHTIVIGSWGWRGPANYDWLVDPDDMGWTNVCYKLHLYADGAEAHNVSIEEIYEIADYGVSVVQSVAGWEVPTLVGEFAGGDSAEHFSYQRFHYGENNMNWTNWLWKNATGKVSGEWSDMGCIVPNPDGWFPIPNLLEDSLEDILAAYELQRTTADSMAENPVAKAGLSIPFAADDNYAMAPGASLYVAPDSGVLTNDRALTGGTMSATLTRDVYNGTLEFWSDGSFSYTPDEGFAGVDSFRYQLSDTHAHSTTDAVVSIRVQPGGLPSGWTASDIGPPVIPGWTYYDASAAHWQLAAAGADIAGSSDEFHFAHVAFSGNAILSAKVESLENTDPWAKSGLMMRVSNAAGSAFAYLFVTPENGIGFEYRSATDGSVASVAYTTGSAPVWLRLVRDDDQFIAYYSYDGQEWVALGSQAIPMEAEFAGGLAVTSHDASQSTISTFTNVKIIASLASPSGVEAVAGDGSVTLAWEAVEDAAVYQVKRSTSDAGPYALVDSTSEFGFVDSGLTNGSRYYYVVSAVNEGVVSAESEAVSAIPFYLPAAWSDLDIGTALEGWSNYDDASAAFTLAASGADIWGSSDGFRFVHQSVTGGCAIVARVTSVPDTDPWAKTGLMFRQSLDADAANVAILVTPENGVSFQARSSSGGETAYQFATGEAPVWIKLELLGETVTGYISSDGASWTAVGTATVSIEVGAYLGLAVSAHDDSSLGVATLDNVTIFPGYSSYQFAYFTSEELADPLVSGMEADANHDGVSNLMAYAVGLSPWVTASESNGGRPVFQADGDYLTLSYVRRTEPVGISYTVKVASDLNLWLSGEAYTTVLSTTPLGGNLESVVVRDNTPISEATRRFMQVQVETTD
ncbi:cellulase family glycosylhydrolase [Coraliomargarita parva]|uniref:cellulase family glycosylhydrolase n=1 Tax=Coraliomargarita parva TaxID=3014050 RepID=UPI0022B3F538|nr:cellulase family glycosylhydrolase [Coraliomargarita parva]